MVGIELMFGCRCANGLTVETTSWEPIRQAQEEDKRAAATAMEESKTGST